MPGQKRFRNKKLPHAKRAYDDKQNKKIMNLEKKVKRIDNTAEVKYKDTLFTTTIPNTGNLMLLNGIVMGDQQIWRNGASIRMTSVQYRCTLFSDPNALTPSRVRIILFIDKQANAANPTIAADPLTGANPALLNNAVINDLVNSPFQHENVERFKILSDKVYTLSTRTVNEWDNAVPPANNLAVGYAIESRSIKKHKKLSVKVAFGDDGNTIASINKNSLFIFMISDQPIELPSCSGGARVYYKDF